MAKDFLSEFLASPVRARLLRLFVFNEETMFGAEKIAKRLRITKRAAEKELYFLERLALVRKIRAEKAPDSAKKGSGKKKGTKKAKREFLFAYNPEFRFRRALNVFVRDVSPVENKNVLGALKSAGRLSVVILSGSFVGDPSRPADLLIAGESLSERRLDRAMRTLEPDVGREIRYAAFSTPEFRYRLTVQDRLLRDTLDYPHRVLLNRGGLLQGSREW